MIKSCYIHIPFCHKICSYCDFCKLLYKEEWVNQYLDALEKEIHDTFQGEVLDTIYIGGGTPSSLSVPQLERLLEILSFLPKSDNVEYTIEGNFSSTTKDKLELYKKYGINRLSFGIESIQDKNLKLLDREESPFIIEEVIHNARELGFSNINVDLMYALPNESLEDLQKDLDYIFSLHVEHISTYSLILEEHTKLFIDGTSYVSEDLDATMYEMICNQMKSHGYTHYEISNFCLDGYHSRHNLVYWNNLEYYGFGLGASSYIGDCRITNTRSFTSYLKGKYVSELEELNLEDKIEYEVILGFRKRDGILLDEFFRKYGKSLDAYYSYFSFVEDKLLCLENNKLFIPEDKWYISNEIIVRLLEKKI